MKKVMNNGINKEIKTNDYDRFTCTADKCSFTCCQEWKITVDDDTFAKWNRFDGKKESDHAFDPYVTYVDDTRVIALNEKKKCPFLNEKQLCNLVLNHGDEVLSETCAVFPRQINKFADRIEYSLDSCCPEAVDLMNQEEKICFTSNLDDKEDDILFQIRSMMMTIMQKEQFSISKGMMMTFYILLDIVQKKTVIKKDIDGYLEEGDLKKFADTIDKMKFRSLDTFEENNELFLDLAENYRKQQLYTTFLEPIAMLAEELSAKYDKNKMTMQLQRFEEQFSAYEKLFRNYLVTEIFSNSMLPDSDLEGLVVMTQWIAMEYVMMRHSLFLHWLLRGEETLSYTDVRDYIVVVSRMMGYDQEDVFEFLEKSFENITWEWGYFALLLGKK